MYQRWDINGTVHAQRIHVPESMHVVIHGHLAPVKATLALVPYSSYHVIMEIACRFVATRMIPVHVNDFHGARERVYVEKHKSMRHKEVTREGQTQSCHGCVLMAAVQGPMRDVNRVLARWTPRAF